MMARHVDAFVLPTNNLAAYRRMARRARRVRVEHGALRHVECAGDNVPKGEVTSFPLALKLKNNETAVFSWIVNSSRRPCDAVMRNAVQDPRILQMMAEGPLPLDGQRMFWGGFKAIVARGG
jgi:uncharacterized protein YbaA (DUF1428 family)